MNIHQSHLVGSENQSIPWGCHSMPSTSNEQRDILRDASTNLDTWSHMEVSNPWKYPNSSSCHINGIFPTLATGCRGWKRSLASVSTPRRFRHFAGIFWSATQGFEDFPPEKKKTWQDFENMPLSPSMMPQSPSLMPQSPSLMPPSPSLQGPVRSFQVKNTFIDVEDSPKEGTWGPETSRRCRSMPPPPMLDTPSEDDDTNTTPDDEVSSPLSVEKTHYSAARRRFTDVVTIHKCLIYRYIGHHRTTATSSCFSRFSYFIPRW